MMECTYWISWAGGSWDMVVSSGTERRESDGDRRKVVTSSSEADGEMALDIS